MRPSGSSGYHRRSQFASLRKISASLQPSSQDLSIDTLSTFSTSRVLRTDADLPLLGDRDLGYSQKYPLGTPHISLTTMRVSENSSDFDSGRRPESKSDEFSDTRIVVSEI